MAKKTFPIEVKGVGNFTFRHRTMRDEFRINAEFSRLTEGVESIPEWVSDFATMISILKVMAETVPDGWDIDDMDSLDPASYNKLDKVTTALNAKEADFRRQSEPESEGSGSSDGRDGGPVVSQDVPATA